MTRTTRFNQREYYKNAETFTKMNVSVPNVEVFVSKVEDHVSAVFFSGKKTKADWRFRFDTEIEMMKYIDSKIKYIHDRNVYKEEKKIKDKILAETNRKEINVGDLFATSWGYEQTNVDFFQVIEKVSATRVKVQRINLKVNETTSWASDNISPIKDDFIGEPMIKTINKYGNISKIDEYGHSGYKTHEGARHHRSWGY